MLRYYFEDVTRCEMCGDSTEQHQVLGQRLNQSQGLQPKRKSGISVSVKKCSNCGLIYASPLPVPFDLQDHYGTPPENYWKPAYFEWHPGYFANEIATARRLLPFRQGMKALDVGAGLGKAMRSLEKAGFDAYGVEPSKPFYNRAVSRMNISPEKLQLGMLEDVVYQDQQFDFINFGAVFEHLYHPAAGLERALQWLKPGGLVHIEVPSADYFVSKLLNLYYKLRGTSYVTHISPMHSPYHLYEFSLKSFQELGRRLPFSVVQSENLVYLTGQVPKLLHPMLHYYMARTNTGMQLKVWLRKN